MYYNLLSQIKNAVQVGKESITVPFSKMDFEVSRVLLEAKYLKGIEKKMVNRKNFMELKLAYENEKPVLEGFKIVSKPGRRFYKNALELKSVKNGFGLAVLSTSKGIMNNKKAKKSKIGGEYLFEIW